MTEDNSVRTVVYTVRDVAASKPVFAALLGEPMVDQPYYVGWHSGGQDFGLAPLQDPDGEIGPVPFWSVADLEASRDAMVAAGGTVVEDVKEVGGGRRVATIADAAGNRIGLLHDSAGKNG